MSCFFADFSIPQADYEVIFGQLQVITWGGATAYSELVHGGPVVDRSSPNYRLGEVTMGIVYAGVTLGEGLVAQGATSGASLAAREIKLVDGFYTAEGSAFKFSKAYYEKLWATGRGAPFLQADEVVRTATSITLDPAGKVGFFRYANDVTEMVYNPVTREVWHLMPIK